MKDRVLIIGRKNEESLQIVKQLADDGLFEADLASTAPEAIDKLTRSKCELLIMNIENFTKKKVQLAQDLRGLGHLMPVLVLAKIIAPNTYDILSHMPSPFFLRSLTS